MQKGKGYYDYTKKYSSEFLNRYQSHNNWWIGRSSGYMELLRLKAERLRGNRNWMWFDVRYGWKFMYIIYFPQFLFLIFSYAWSPIYRRYDSRYHLKFIPGEFTTDDWAGGTEEFVTWQPRKKPLTRRKYSDAVKLVYDGAEEPDFIPEQPLRYR